MKLTDDVLAELLEKAQRLYAHPCSDAWSYEARSDYGDVVTDLGSTTYILAKCPDEEVARYIEAVEPRMVSALVREVQRLRKEARRSVPRLE